MSCLSLFQCYLFFALFFAIKSIYDHYLSLCGIEYAVRQDKSLNKRDFVIGVNINNSLKLILQQSLIFILFKFAQLIFFNLGWL